jgi:hypothetical protein
MRLRTSVLAVAIAAALPSIAAAVDFSYNGFSTAAYSQTDTDKAQVGYSGEPHGIDSDGSLKFDSKLGLQVTAKFNDVLSATVQGVAYSDLTSTWEPRLDWAYVRWQALPNLSARAGYMRAPLFMFSDSVFIGYSNVWVRAPVEVYNETPVYQLRGVDLNWTGAIGPVNVSLQPYFGDTEVEYGAAPTRLDVKDWGGLVAAAQYGSLTLRASYSQYEIDSPIPSLAPLLAGLKQVPGLFCPACSYIADEMQLQGSVYKFLAFGAQYDDGSNVAIGEFGRRRDNRAIMGADMHDAYVTYGRRFGGFMPYFTSAIHRVDTPTSTTAVPAVGPLAPLAAGVNLTLGSTSDQDSYSVGVRYELPSFSVVRGALLKLQYDRIDTDGGPGDLNFIVPGFDGTVDMISMSLDVIF